MLTCRETKPLHKLKNRFPEMKGDVGMSCHEKEREQEDAYTKRESHSTPSLQIIISTCSTNFFMLYIHILFYKYACMEVSDGLNR